MRHPSQFWLTVLLIAVLVVSLAPCTSAGDEFRYPEGRHGKGELRYFNGIPVLVVRGTNTEMGEQIGRLALKPAVKIVELVNGFANRQIPASVRPICDLAVQSMYTGFPPEYRSEIEAMANAAGVDKKSLQMANTIIDLGELIGCSSLLISSDRSTTKGPLYGRNLDLPHVEGLADFSLLIVYKPDKGHAFAMPNLPGFLMLASGMNDCGVALGSQSVGAPHDGSPRFNPAGVASAVAGRRLVEKCEDVAAAGKWLAANRLTRCVSIAACDTTEQVVFEVTTERVLSRRASDGICCATNHFRCPELASKTECWRYSRLDAVRKSDHLEVRDVWDQMKTVHQGKMTVHTMVFEPATLQLHLAMGSPATDCPMTTIDLKELLNQETTRPPSHSDQGGRPEESVRRESN